MKQKFVLEFDEVPDLVFVQEKNKRPKVYQDGKEVNGIIQVRISAGANELTTHEIEYATGHTSKG